MCGGGGGGGRAKRNSLGHSSIQPQRFRDQVDRVGGFNRRVKKGHGPEPPCPFGSLMGTDDFLISTSSRVSSIFLRPLFHGSNLF